MKKKISVYIRNKTINPSGYYRIYQYLSKINLKETEVCYRESVSDGIYRRYHFANTKLNTILYVIDIEIRTLYQLMLDNIVLPNKVIINREICPRYRTALHGFLEGRLVKKVDTIWDFDDAIIGGEISLKEWNLLNTYASKIIVTNNYLKKQLSNVDERRVIILPTTDGDYLYSLNEISLRKQSFVNEIRMIWIATASNKKSLDLVIDELDEAATILKKKYNKQLKLICICNIRIDYPKKNLVIDSKIWSREIALNELKKAHIGIMPLIQDSFSLGKGGFKLIQYIAAGIPVIASPVGMNKDIVKKSFGVLSENGNWCNSIETIISDEMIWSRMSLMARHEWENSYSYNRCLRVWKELVLE